MINSLLCWRNLRFHYDVLLFDEHFQTELWKHSNQALPYLIKKLIKKFVRLNQIQKSRATLHFGLMLETFRSILRRNSL